MSKSYLGHDTTAGSIFSFYAVIITFHEIIRTVTHEIIPFSVESGVMRISDYGTSGGAFGFGATPMAICADAIFAAFGYFGTRLERLSMQLTRTIFFFDAMIIVFDGTNRAKATFFAIVI